MAAMNARNAPGWRHGSLVGAALGGVLVVAGVALLPRAPMGEPGAPAIATRAGGTVPAATTAPPPPVEPAELAPIAPADAVAINAEVPFSTLPNPAARPFRFPGGTEDRARAIDCLASAMLYEAGQEGDDGQRAVGQVVLNRVRHPAFPKTVCGVVFQGQERRTGCQFTFTCDGALTRRPSPAAWERSRGLARAMLDGRVHRPVGQATHYHTDWVVPYWSASLDKIVAVGTHLFFRWTGWWGTPPAFTGRHPGAEPAVARIAFLSSAHAEAEALAEATLPIDEVGVPIAATVRPPTLLIDERGAAGAAARPADARRPAGPAAPRLAADAAAGTLSPGEDSFIYLLDGGSPDAFPAVARRVCGSKAYCKFQGWTDRAQVPAGYPVPAARLVSMSFSYLRDRSTGFDKMLWNCTQFPRRDQSQCMRG